MKNTILLFSAFISASVPEWIQLVPSGTFRGVDGRGPYTLSDADTVIRNSMASGKIAIDECHSTDLAGPKGFSAPARGWVEAMEAREDGIWGKVKWTKEGHSLVEDEAYRGISPVLMSDRSGRIVRILRASLTNDPNLSLKTLHHKEDTSMTLLKSLQAALGLKDDADETACLTALEAVLKSKETHASDLKRIADEIQFPDTDITPDKLVTHLQARKSDPSEDKNSNPEVEGMKKTIISLQAQVDASQLERKREKAISAVDAAIHAGKPIRPLRDHYISRHMSDPESAQMELDALPSIHAGAYIPQKDPAQSGSGLSTSDLEVCSLMGIDPKEFAKTLEGQKKEIL